MWFLQDYFKFNKLSGINRQLEREMLVVLFLVFAGVFRDAGA
jgi:hypothetical protein